MNSAQTCDFYQIHWTSFSFQNDFKIQELPLARIKKIMKQDEEVKVSINLIEKPIDSFRDCSVERESVIHTCTYMYVIIVH